MTVIIIEIGAPGTVTKSLVQGLRDYSIYSIVEIDQNTKASSGDLRRLPVS